MKQMTLIAKDEVGVLADISYILGKARINIESITVASVEAKAIITMFVKDEKRAKELLRANGLALPQAPVNNPRNLNSLFSRRA